MAMDNTLSLYEQCVRKLRYMRATGRSQAEMQAYAKNLQRNLAIDPAKILAASQEPGEINGYPYLAQTEGRP